MANTVASLISVINENRINILKVVDEAVKLAGLQTEDADNSQLLEISLQVLVEWLDKSSRTATDTYMGVIVPTVIESTPNGLSDMVLGAVFFSIRVVTYIVSICPDEIKTEATMILAQAYSSIVAEIVQVGLGKK